MTETIDTTPSPKNRNSSDSGSDPVPILDEESEQLRLRIKEVVGDRSVRSFADAAGIGPTSLRNYIEGERKPKRPAIEKIAFEAQVSSEWLATGREPKYRNGVSSYAPVGATVLRVMENQPLTGLVNPVLLSRCFNACREVHGEDFMKTIMSVQLQYTADFYNQLIAVATAKGGQASLDDFTRLTPEELSSQLRYFIKIGWARKFPCDNVALGGR